MKTVHFADSIDGGQIFLTTIETFQPAQGESLPEVETNIDMIEPVLLLVNQTSRTVFLDTQSAIHLVCNGSLLAGITQSTSPITVQGITKDRIRVTQEGFMSDVGVHAYCCEDIAANILSYHKLQETHHVAYDELNDSFSVIPRLMGPVLYFACKSGHCTLDLDGTSLVFISSVNRKAAKYSKRQLEAANKAHDFIIRMGFISYKAAAEVVQRGSITGLGFTRADLVAGLPAAYQQGHGTQRSSVGPREDDPIPVHESVEQELQVDLFLFLGHVFLLSISVLMGLIMVTQLGPGFNADGPDRIGERSKSKAGRALLEHIQQYNDKGFQIKRVTSDGEPSIKAAKSELSSIGVELNVLGHGSHTPHAESAIRHVKNKARSTIHSLQFPLPKKFAAALIGFVVHLANMIPKVNSVGHLPAHAAFLGRVPNFTRDAPFAFGTTGFLQRAPGQKSNTAASRGDYCLWLGTTRNLAGTHRCFNLDTLMEMTGDIFRPAPLTTAALQRLQRLSGLSLPEAPIIPQLEAPLENPSAPYPLDPNRGVVQLEVSPLSEDIPPA
jgi:hypothetical protein